MITDEVIDQLKRSSKRGAIVSLAGVIAIAGALLFSFHYLSKQVVRVQALDAQIAEKESRIKGLDRDLQAKGQQLNATEKVCSDFQSVVEEEYPEAAKSALKQTVENNPGSKDVLESLSQVATQSQGQSSKLSTAKQKEREGFEKLISGDYAGAADAFKAAEKAFPSYHNVYELSKILNENRAQMDTPAKKQEVFSTIVKKYSYGAPPDLWRGVKAAAGTDVDSKDVEKNIK
jgi:hypothetical protein